ncbi:MAG: RnfABCDGE type electron transport complex subunit A [Spirochaetes bacterium]|jgi:electron transport complex protein RnfA|nr:RnfABCDGE type electron transport complex subunit A [Spirochaetota bacterium]
MEIKIFLTILFSTIFINNYVLSQTLGICPFLGVSKKTDSAAGMGFAVIFVMTIASIITYFIYKYILLRYDIVYLRTIAFILVIASIVQLVEMAINKLSPVLYRALGIFLPLITTNCAVLGVAVLNVESGFITSEYGLLMTMVQGFGAGVGFLLALMLMSGIRERLETADIPFNLKGMPITFIIAGLLSLAFMGFAGMSF